MKKAILKYAENKVIDLDVTSLKAKHPDEIYLGWYKRIAGILAALIFSASVISACSNAKPSKNAPPAVGSPEATVAAPFSTPSAAPSSTPVSTATPAATVAAVTTSAPSPGTQQITIAAASEELSEKGFEEYNQYNFDSAINYFNQAISADQNNYKAYAGKGCSLCFKGSYSEGMPLIQKALGMKSDYSAGYFYLAMGYKLQKDYDNSLLNFDKAISLNPRDTWSYYGIATIYADRGDINTSLDYLKKAIDLDPSVKEVAREQDHFQPYLNNEAFQKLVG